MNTNYKIFNYPVMLYISIGALFFVGGTFLLRLTEDPKCLILTLIGVSWWLLGWLIYETLLNSIGFTRARFNEGENSKIEDEESDKEYDRVLKVIVCFYIIFCVLIIWLGIKLVKYSPILIIASFMIIFHLWVYRGLSVIREILNFLNYSEVVAALDKYIKSVKILEEEEKVKREKEEEKKNASTNKLAPFIGGVLLLSMIWSLLPLNAESKYTRSNINEGYEFSVSHYKKYLSLLNEDQERANEHLGYLIQGFAENENNAKSILSLGIINLEGLGVEKNNQYAYNFIRKVADIKSPDYVLYKETYFQLSNDYLYKKNISIHIEAQRKLGYMLYYGINFPMNKKEGLYWINKAAENKDEIAIRWIAQRFLEGDADGWIIKNENTANKLFEIIENNKKIEDLYKTPRERISNEKLWEKIYHWFLRLDQIETIFDSTDWGWKLKK